MNDITFASMEQAIADIQQGKMIILVDDENRENEGDLIIAAEKITPQAVNFLTKYGRGLLCMPMAASEIERLNLPMMVKNNQSKYQTAFTVSIGATKGISTGISAYDRAETIRVAINPNSGPADIVSPGHVFPLCAKSGGVLVRQGHTEASVDLAKLAGLAPAAVLCEILKEDGHMARRDDLVNFAKEHHLSLVSIEDLVTYRINHEEIIEEVASSTMPMQNLEAFQIKVFKNKIDGSEHVALIKGDLKHQANLVRIHSECMTGDIFGSMRCDCGKQLTAAMHQINQSGGVLLYMSQEGRGIGLSNKIKAYSLQEKGLDTVEANHQLGFPDDQRDYGVAAQMLRKLGVNKLKLLTNNPRKIDGLKRYGIEDIERVALETEPNANNICYLKTKRDKMGHLLSLEVENR